MILLSRASTLTPAETVVAHGVKYRSPSVSKHWALLSAAANCLMRSPLRSILIVVCLVGLLSPLAVAVAVCDGVKSQYRHMLEEGGDVYVTRDHYGSNAPVELTMIKELEQIQGVIRVVPRIVGRTYAQGKFLAVLGMAPEFLPRSIKVVEGRRPRTGGDVIMGRQAARYLGLRPGSRFTIQRNPRRVYEVAGLFECPWNVWNSDLMIMGFTDGAELFDLDGVATDLSVYTRPGYEEIVDVIVQLSQRREQAGEPPLRVQSRNLIERYTQRGFDIKSGVFTGLYCVALALGIPSIGLISGFGLWERRRQIGVMKAQGWQTQEVLEMVAFENLILSLLGIPLILFCAAIWIHGVNGEPISHFVVANFNLLIPFPVPARLFPVPVFLSAFLAVILTMAGSIYSTWRTAVVPPVEAMRL